MWRLRSEDHPEFKASSSGWLFGVTVWSWLLFRPSLCVTGSASTIPVPPQVSPPQHIMMSSSCQSWKNYHDGTRAPWFPSLKPTHLQGGPTFLGQPPVSSEVPARQSQSTLSVQCMVTTTLIMTVQSPHPFQPHSFLGLLSTQP